MNFRLGRFFLDEKDLFLFFFGIVILVGLIGGFTLPLFRWDSLFVIFLYLFVTRSLVNSARFESYFFFSLIGLFLSLFLSPYGVAIFLLITYLLNQRR